MIEYDTISTVEVRQQFANFVNRISVLKEWILISRRGKPIAGAVPLEDFEYFEGPEDSTSTQGMQTFEDILA
jgi:PHD/YefM family antitoxin component YafN of YafNO toxin-antitoxin module